MAGRPKKEIDFETVEKLCQIQCTGEEIAAVLGVDYDTLATRVKEEYNMKFSEYFEQKKAGGRASLRRRQWLNAEGGNTTMQIWLGKQYLGQSDKQQTELTGKDGGAIEVESPRDKITSRIDSVAARQEEERDS